MRSGISGKSRLRSGANSPSAVNFASSSAAAFFRLPSPTGAID